MKKIVIMILFVVMFNVLASPIKADNHNVLLTNDNDVEVFTKPQIDSEKYPIDLASNQTYFFNEKVDDFYSIDFLGHKGYIHANAVEKTMYSQNQSFDLREVNNLTVITETDLLISETSDYIGKITDELPILSVIDKQTDDYYVEIGGHQSVLRTDNVEELNTNKAPVQKQNNLKRQMLRQTYQMKRKQTLQHLIHLM
ncbi:hypothetical protein [Halolactibacillus sp. JCM 19043]|uniref:hypothetical protein n=1 Tax=Halolactibacillus sp. JCM 19043 TaxID=1460638 RepID=UPI0012E3229B|nr:hypothetical protein [Halolactibacillus sp. JCM 19043]